MSETETERAVGMWCRNSAAAASPEIVLLTTNNWDTAVTRRQTPSPQKFVFTTERVFSLN